MGTLFIFAFLFCVGSLAGWVLELFYRHFFSKVNGKKRWINPGFFVGPYLPIYGVGLCTLYALAMLPLNFVEPEWLRKLVLFLCMAVCMTLIELVAGLIFFEKLHVKLWDYSDQPLNFKGIICPTFSFYWSVLGALYYFLIHPRILRALQWLSENLTFSFFIGLFFGVFLVDFAYSLQIVRRVRQFAIDNQIAVRYEELKAHIQETQRKQRDKVYFFFSFSSRAAFSEGLAHYLRGRIKEDDFRLLRKKSKQK